MHTLTLGQLKLGLQNLFSERQTDLLKSKSGKFREPELKEQLQAIQALPAALTGGKPHADELHDADRTHDSFGAAIYYITETVFRLPDSTPELIAAATRVRSAFIPTMDQLKADYSLEAERAQDRKPLIKSMKSDLQSLTAPDGRTLLEIANLFLQAGEKLEDLLHQRANVPKASRKDAAKIRSETIGVLTAFRTDLRKELGRDSSLASDLEHRVFGFFDMLSSMKRSSPAKATEPQAPAEPPPSRTP